MWIKESLTLSPAELAEISVWLRLPWTAEHHLYRACRYSCAGLDFATLLPARNVCYWHKADICLRCGDVRFGGVKRTLSCWLRVALRPPFRKPIRKKRTRSKTPQLFCEGVSSSAWRPCHPHPRPRDPTARCGAAAAPSLQAARVATGRNAILCRPRSKL